MIKSGLTTEVKVKYLALENGIMVSTPEGDCSRYDQIWDVNGRLLRVQIKTSKLIDDGSGFEFPGRNKNGRYTSEQIDGMATVFDGKCYFVPVDKCGYDVRLRYTLPKNGRPEQTKFAHDYELARILNIK